MAEGSDQEKTEEPTEKKLSDARKKGQIARSKETGTAVVLIMSAVSLLIYGPAIGAGLHRVMARLLNLNRNEAFDTTKMFAVWGDIGKELWFGMTMFVLVILVAAFIGNTFLGGFNFSWSAAAPKANKLSPYQGFKRMFGPQAVIELVKGLLKFLLVAFTAVLLIKMYFYEMFLTISRLRMKIKNRSFIVV